MLSICVRRSGRFHRLRPLPGQGPSTPSWRACLLTGPTPASPPRYGASRCPEPDLGKPGATGDGITG